MLPTFTPALSRHTTLFSSLLTIIASRFVLVGVSLVSLSTTLHVPRHALRYRLAT